MPRHDLDARAVDLRELMDDPDCDPTALDRTFRRFALVNALVSGWKATFRDLVAPSLQTAAAAGRVSRVLDLGCGGGDLARSIARWSRRAGYEVEVLGVDPDDRAMRAARRMEEPGVAFASMSSSDLVRSGERFDVVVSNHVLHHLSAAELHAFLSDSAELADTGVHSDIRRSVAAYRAYAATVWTISAGTFVRVDGLRSIRRSYTVPELQAALPAGWRALARSPHRVVALREPPPVSPPLG